MSSSFYSLHFLALKPLFWKHTNKTVKPFAAVRKVPPPLPSPLSSLSPHCQPFTFSDDFCCSAAATRPQKRQGVGKMEEPFYMCNSIDLWPIFYGVWSPDVHIQKKGGGRGGGGCWNEDRGAMKCYDCCFRFFYTLSLSSASLHRLDVSLTVKTSHVEASNP